MKKLLIVLAMSCLLSCDSVGSSTKLTCEVKKTKTWTKSFTNAKNTHLGVGKKWIFKIKGNDFYIDDNKMCCWDKEQNSLYGSTEVLKDGVRINTKFYTTDTYYEYEKYNKKKSGDLYHNEIVKINRYTGEFERLKGYSDLGYLTWVEWKGTCKKTDNKKF